MALDKQDLEDIKDLMVETIGPMFEDQAERLDGIENRLHSFENRLFSLEKGQQELLARVERIENELLGMRSDIKDVLDRIFTLEKRFPNLSEKEVRELEKNLNSFVAWAKEVSTKTGIPLKV